MSAYIITNSELVAIANAIREKLSSDNNFTLDDMPTAIANIGTITGSGATVAVGNNTKYLINETKLIAIANAVRLKNGSSSQYLLSELPQAILDIVTITYTVNYYNGSTLLYSEDVPAGSNSSYVGSIPTKTQDAQYSYTFSGWSDGVDDNIVDSNTLNNITEDKNVYACFTSTLRTYTVTFVRAATDGGGTLQTLNNVAYGTILTNSSYTGSTPTTTQGSGSDYAFLGWTPAFTAITGDTTYTAQFDTPIKEITDTWNQIIANIDNGTYSTKYKIGNYKPLDLGETYGTINMQIVAMDKDQSSNNENIPLSFIAMKCLKGDKKYHNTQVASINWSNCDLASFLNTTLYEAFPSLVKNRIIPAKKYYTKDNFVYNNIWIPSHKEIGRTSAYTNYTANGISYIDFFNNQTKRQRSDYSASGWYRWYCLREKYPSVYTIAITGTGDSNYTLITNDNAVVIGFCLGLEQETITDSWQTILSNPNYATDYNIGDTKQIDLGTEGKHLMQIIAFNEDDRADGNGKAGITWLSKTLLNTSHRFNPMGSSSAPYIEGTGAIGGYPKSEFRSYIVNDIASLIPSEIQNKIILVKKYSLIFDINGSQINNFESNEKIWIPSIHELFSDNNWHETIGATYFTSNSGREKRIKRTLNGELQSYCTRTAYAVRQMYTISTNGSWSSSFEIGSPYIALGFCTN